MIRLTVHDVDMTSAQLARAFHQKGIVAQPASRGPATRRGPDVVQLLVDVGQDTIYLVAWEVMRIVHSKWEARQGRTTDSLPVPRAEVVVRVDGEEVDRQHIAVGSSEAEQPESLVKAVNTQTENIELTLHVQTDDRADQGEHPSGNPDADEA